LSFGNKPRVLNRSSTFRSTVALTTRPTDRVLFGLTARTLGASKSLMEQQRNFVNVIVD
jgi:hypothetical protein